MGFFYYDDSRHPKRGKFAVGAFVYFDEDPAPLVVRAIEGVGLQPYVDEFKSGSRMDRHPEQALLREALARIEGRMALVVCPHEECAQLGHLGVAALAKLLAKVQPKLGEVHQAYFDQGLFRSVQMGENALRGAGIDGLVVGHFEQDSKRVLGLQVADLAAHTCATMLLEQLGFVEKLVKAGAGSGYDPDAELELGFELWARMRYRWFAEADEDGSAGADGSSPSASVRVSGHGLFVSPACVDVLRNAAESRFGSVYLGCVH